MIGAAHFAILGGWSNDGVKVLNLFWANGTPAQDQLVYMPDSVTTTAAVPEPGTIVLLGTGMAAAIRRRRRSRVTAG